MKLYREVPIESAEQAEALPDGALLLLDGEDPAVKGKVDTSDGACRVWIAGGDGFHTTVTIVAEHKVTHLAPIQAEEETRIDPEVFAEIDARLAYTQAAYALPPGELQLRHVTRLVTPWTTKEEA